MEVAVYEMRRIGVELQHGGFEIEPCMRSSELIDFERSHLLRYISGQKSNNYISYILSESFQGFQLDIACIYWR
jgi:hypothetical protein